MGNKSGNGHFLTGRKLFLNRVELCMEVESHSSLQLVLLWNYIKNDQHSGATVSLTVPLSLVTESNRMIFKFGLRLGYRVAPARDICSRSVSE